MDARNILAIPVPLEGHMSPMLILCSKLPCNKAIFLITQDKVQTMERLVGQLEEAGDLAKGVASVEIIPYSLPPAFTGGAEGIKLLGEELLKLAGPTQEVARMVNRLTPMSLVLADINLSWTRHISKELGVPRFPFFHTLLGELAIRCHIPVLISEGTYDPLKENDPEARDMDIFVPGLPLLKHSDIPRVSQFPEGNKYYWDYLLHHVKFEDAKCILVNSVYELEKDTYDSMVEEYGLPLQLVGPLTFPSPKVTSSAVVSSCLSWLDMQAPRSVLYVSFGSFLQMTSSELEEIFLGIQESSRKFLLAFRMDVVMDEPSSTLQEFVKRYQDPESFGEQGLVVAWAPQIQVLNHTATGGFFTHYGWNSVLESVAAGVPMIGKPILGDQFLIRKLAIEQWGIAASIEGESLSREAMARAVTRLFDSTRIKENAMRLQTCIQRLKLKVSLP